MDKLTRYRNLIQQIISDLAALIESQRTPEQSGAEALCAFDQERDQYLLVKTGWSGKRRVRGTTIYVRLKNGKFWIEEDMTEDGVANRLLEAGVPKDDIVLAFQPPEMRQHTEFAVA